MWIDERRNKVEAAADFLDKYGPANWRSRIDIERLDMISTTECVLGQVYGDYYDAYNDFEQGPHSIAFANICNAFSGYTSEWCAHLSEWHENEAKKPELSGLWYGEALNANILTTFEDDGKTFVVYKVETSRYTRTESEFRSNFTKEPRRIQYVDGRLYRGKKKGTEEYIALVYSSTIYMGDPGFMVLSEYRTMYSGVDWYEETYGPLVEIEGVMRHDGKKMDVTFS